MTKLQYIKTDVNLEEQFFLMEGIKIMGFVSILNKTASEFFLHYHMALHKCKLNEISEITYISSAEKVCIIFVPII